MRKLLITTAFLLASTSAFATDHKPAPAAPGSSATAGAAAVAGASASNVNRNTVRATGGRASATGGSSNVTVNGGGGGYGGGYSARGNTPDVFIPSIATGNSCALAASAGAAFSGLGFGFGTAYEGKKCELRQLAGLFQSMGMTLAAREALCQIDEGRRAMFSSGAPCARDVQGWQR